MKKIFIMLFSLFAIFTASFAESPTVAETDVGIVIEQSTDVQTIVFDAIITAINFDVQTKSNGAYIRTFATLSEIKSAPDVAEVLLLANKASDIDNYLTDTESNKSKPLNTNVQQGISAGGLPYEK